MTNFEIFFGGDFRVHSATETYLVFPSANEASRLAGPASGV